jgi:hypothetical protein
MLAFCYASGHIDFGRRIPAGATVIARGPKDDLRKFIGANARTYTTRRGRNAGTVFLLVPGMPEATSPIIAVQRLEAWCKRISIETPRGVRVVPR